MDTKTSPLMRAAWASSESFEDPLSCLRVGHQEVPKATEGWVRVKVSGVGLNYHDLITLRGRGMFELKYPLILGNEGTGILDNGEEVIIFPVLGNPLYKGDGTLDPDRHILGEFTQGSLAEYVIVPEKNVIKKPQDTSMQTAAVLGIAWLTAYRMLFTQSGLRKGQKMLVQGSAGGVATALIQLGHAAGMIVWTTGRSDEKRALASELGAHCTFRSGEQLPEKVDAVFDTSGEQTFEHSLESLQIGGTLVCCGLHAGETSAKVDLMKLIAQSIHICGSYAGTREEFKGLVKFVSEHGVEPHVQAVLPLEETGEGLRMISEGQVKGKIVIRVQPQ
jgi:NADPH:quinone reductase-like Zn-dependent oxidoreductase